MFRYIFGGMFARESGEMVQISIPSPFAYDTEEEAEMDGSAYRFGWVDGGPAIMAYGREEIEDHLNPDGSANVWAVGMPITIISYAQFLNRDGKLYDSDNYYIDEDGTAQYEELDCTFRDLFPSMTEESKEIYINSVCYHIREE